MTTQPSDWAVRTAFLELTEAAAYEVLNTHFREEVLIRARELDASGGRHGVPPEVVGSFVEKAAQIISGALFPSGRSLYKARQISDLALSMYATPRAAEAGDDL